jgi:hypothetical protein
MTLILLLFLSIATIRPAFPCPVDGMLEQVLAQPLFDAHRESDSDYYLFENELSEGCETVKFGTKTLKSTDSKQGNVFMIKVLEYDSLKIKSNMKILLEGDNLLIDAWFLRSEEGWRFEKLSFIET